MSEQPSQLANLEDFLRQYDDSAGKPTQESSLHTIQQSTQAVNQVDSQPEQQPDLPAELSTPELNKLLFQIEAHLHNRDSDQLQAVIDVLEQHGMMEHQRVRETFENTVNTLELGAVNELRYASQEAQRIFKNRVNNLMDDLNVCAARGVQVEPQRSNIHTIVSSLESAVLTTHQAEVFSFAEKLAYAETLLANLQRQLEEINTPARRNQAPYLTGMIESSYNSFRRFGIDEIGELKWKLDATQRSLVEIAQTLPEKLRYLTAAGRAVQSGKLMLER